MMSLICTSNAAKPARSNAAAISICPFTPCSRRMAMRGRTPVAINGAAISCDGSKVSEGARPASAPSRIRSYSSCAHCGLSRSVCMRYVVSDHARCKSTRFSHSTSCSPARTHNVASLFNCPMRRHITPADSNESRTADSSPARTCNTTPSSSLNSVSIAAAGSGNANVTPVRPANIISHTVANNPPSALS